ncbi:hypothetical protein CspeluHIS016_0901730 [Cutaneotrichosporon spelunceum]|uniref:Uncharacterized protein n=1 Tax=Cutaneotrichosporon spelunceum TaxID=1672016 RepID=A0AAD3U0D4_9TREE|nr:hypothetical protein CspeluHIS016_0901730 [Cutaneotrichosporon spelunceum]
MLEMHTARPLASLARLWRRFLLFVRGDDAPAYAPAPTEEELPVPTFVVERIASPAELAAYVEEERARTGASEGLRGSRPPPRNRSLGGLRAAL